MRIQSFLALMLALIFIFIPLNVCVAGNDEVLKQVYESNLRLTTYGEGKYVPQSFAVANKSEEYAEFYRTLTPLFQSL